MTYDYSSANNRLELPNPFRVENIFLFLCAAALAGAGLMALGWARSGLQTGTARSLVPLIVGVGLLASGVAFAVVAARRLRFFFGRGRPVSLAPEVAVSATGNSKAADTYKHMLRQGGIPYPEPQGALNGVLYHLIPKLITAPKVVQDMAQLHFFNALSFLVTALSFVFAWAFFGTDTTKPLISLVYFVFAAVVLLRPLLSGGQARMNTATLLGLTVIAVIGPVLAGMLKTLPTVQQSFHGQTFFLLGAALVAVLLVLLALLAQIDQSPQTERSCEQLSISMNGPPGAMINELDRILQDEWVEKIPNRRYSRLEPVTNNPTGSGQFVGELFEETQPMPVSGTAAPTLSSAFYTARHRWLAILDVYATLIVMAGIAFALSYVRSIAPDADQTPSSPYALIGYSVICFVVASFCFQSASAVWGRFNFESVLVWVEMSGAWQSARIGTGNQFSGQLRSESEVVRVESMTLRVWRARIESVVFGKDSDRQVTAMYGTTQEARDLAERLTQFAGQQSVFVAPRASEDARRLGALNQSEARLAWGQQDERLKDGTKLSDALKWAKNSLSNPKNPGQISPSNAAGSIPPASSFGRNATGGTRYCTACGAQMGASAKFCGECGRPQAPARAG